MAGNEKICIRIQSQLILPEFVYLMLSLWKEQLTSSKKQYTKSGVQRSLWSVLRKPQFFHTFSVILILSNYRKCMGKSRFGSWKVWRLTQASGGLRMSQVWNILKPFVSCIFEEKGMSLSGFFYCICSFVWSTHLFVIGCYFCCLMSLFQGHIACRNLP